MNRIAALYVATGGPYFGLEGVDPWDEARDARMYGGPYPVVAHSPCQRWGRMWKGQPGNIKAGKVERKGGWIRADDYGWTCRVEQGRYGHYCPKPTWLYAVGIDPLPELRWGISPPPTEKDFPPEAIEKHGLDYCKRAGVMAFRGGGKDSPARIHTPTEFRDLLIAMARSVDCHT